MSNPLHPAYLAGIVDGEGHVGLKKQWKNRSSFLRISIYSSSREFLETLRESVRGSIHTKSTRENDFVLETTCAAAEELFWMIDPYILLKRRQFEVVKEFLKIKHDHPHRKGHTYTDDELESFGWFQSEISRINRLSHREDPDLKGSR